MDETTEGAAGSRATVWLDAGQELLRTGGAGSVKLQALTQVTGLSTGSFYHHFSGMADYLERLADYYGTDLAQRGIEMVAGRAPIERLRGLGRVAVDDDIFPLDEAMRDWAGSNQTAAAAVKASDATLLEFIAVAFEELGYDEWDARVRAFMWFTSGVARVGLPWPRTPNAEDILSVLTADKPDVR